MDWIQALGFLAALLMFSTFYMKNMIPLRIIGMASNVTFIIYAGITHVWPLFVLHIVLLPMNFFRLIQMIRLIEQVQLASYGDISFDFMIPHMTKENLLKGEFVFHRGDAADKIYLLMSGTLTVYELGVTIIPTEIFGEMGIFSCEQKRLYSLRCDSDVELLSLTNNIFKQLFYQNPKFGFYLMQLLLKRFDKNDLKLKEVISCVGTAGKVGNSKTMPPRRSDNGNNDPVYPRKKTDQSVQYP